MTNLATIQQQCTKDNLDPTRAAAFQVALGQQPSVKAGSVLPPFFHQLYFWEPHPPQELGRDGHPMVGGLIPDMGLPRRMWAGGRMTFLQPLIAGVEAVKRTCCQSVQHKNGLSGPLGFVTLRHEIWQNEMLCLTEFQDLVYLPDAISGVSKPPVPPARQDAETICAVGFTSTLLFRYSALTFNGHRIHYDSEYAREVEGYGGLVVHGPLLAQMLMLKAQDELGPLSRFNFRATAPLIHSETASLCRNGRDLWVRGPDGRQCMVAQA
mgnify:FL=1|tara:strand:- start:473 stop:1273 length:801 start_codon:yes stop_codon:yes gene_type:complete